MKKTQGGAAVRARITAGSEGGRMLRPDDVSLRKPKAGKTQQISFRLPPDAIAYYESESQTTGRAKVDVVIDALYLERDLSRRLAHLRPELEQAASEMGLTLDFDLAEVLAKLVARGLRSREPVERDSSTRK